jgi:hypothetical protein
MNRWLNMEGNLVLFKPFAGLINNIPYWEIIATTGATLLAQAKLNVKASLSCETCIAGLSKLRHVN